jgi:hypothetical protein
MSSLTESMSWDWYSAMAPVREIVSAVARRRQRKRTSNLRSNEESVELGENAEHFVRVPCSTEAVTKARDDVVLYAGNSLVVGRLGGDPDLGSFCSMREESV